MMLGPNSAPSSPPETPVPMNKKPFSSTLLRPTLGVGEVRVAAVDQHVPRREQRVERFHQSVNRRTRLHHHHHKPRRLQRSDQLLQRVAADEVLTLRPARHEVVHFARRTVVHRHAVPAALDVQGEVLTHHGQPNQSEIAIACHNRVSFLLRVVSVTRERTAGFVPDAAAHGERECVYRPVIVPAAPRNPQLPRTEGSAPNRCCEPSRFRSGADEVGVRDGRGESGDTRRHSVFANRQNCPQATAGDAPHDRSPLYQGRLFTVILPRATARWQLFFLKWRTDGSRRGARRSRMSTAPRKRAATRPFS